jgi:hypothetical protein
MNAGLLIGSTTTRPAIARMYVGAGSADGRKRCDKLTHQDWLGLRNQNHPDRTMLASDAPALPFFRRYLPTDLPALPTYLPSFLPTCPALDGQPTTLWGPLGECGTVQVAGSQCCEWCDGVVAVPNPALTLPRGSW